MARKGKQRRPQHGSAWHEIAGHVNSTIALGTADQYVEEGRNPLPAVGVSAAMIYVGFMWIQGKQAD